MDLPPSPLGFVGVEGSVLPAPAFLFSPRGSYFGAAAAAAVVKMPRDWEAWPGQG